VLLHDHVYNWMVKCQQSLHSISNRTRKHVWTRQCQNCNYWL